MHYHTSEPLQACLYSKKHVSLSLCELLGAWKQLTVARTETAFECNDGKHLGKNSVADHEGVRASLVQRHSRPLALPHRSDRAEKGLATLCRATLSSRHQWDQPVAWQDPTILCPPESSPRGDMSSSGTEGPSWTAGDKRGNPSIELPETHTHTIHMSRRSCCQRLHRESTQRLSLCDETTGPTMKPQQATRI